jgi:hypothetical protein
MELRREVPVRPRQLGQARRQAGKNRGRHGTVIPTLQTPLSHRVTSLVITLARSSSSHPWDKEDSPQGNWGNTISEEKDLNVPHLRVHTITLHVCTFTLALEGRWDPVSCAFHTWKLSTTWKTWRPSS